MWVLLFSSSLHYNAYPFHRNPIFITFLLLTFLCNSHALRKDWWNPTSNFDDSLHESKRPLKITFSKPAKNWTDAIPIGNGRLGAMVWGGVASEILQLNGNE